MSDENMDLCECIWGHELAMRRLLNVVCIRNSQYDCTDNECFDDGFQRQNPDSNVLLMTLLLVAAMFLYYFRPSSQRINDDATKPGNNNNDRNGAPPSPPSTLF
ncbi:C34C12.4 -like protein [Asbolus verrucosus]|uniref:Small integral membrane protein 14 n=1 Tax=Asbolus verrucosus TaxID=1661398 RepID=A0A482W6I9_ASBVE|nr:C34C12.4 -like protein [Asbolus verrucosus]